MIPIKVFKDEKAPAFALLSATLQAFGTEIIETEPELLKEEIEKKYDLTLSQLQSDKIQAAMVVMATNQFEEDWRVFETVCNVFCNQAVDPDVVNPAEAEEIATALAEVALIRNCITSEDEVGLRFSDEVRAYAGKMFYEYGFSKPPSIFPSAIMPANVVECDDTPKNDSLLELFSTKAELIVAYLED